MQQALKEHTRVRITQKYNQSISTNLININPTLQQLLWLFVIIVIIIINN